MKEQVPYINIHTHRIFGKDELFILNVSPERYVDGGYCSVGIHPWYINFNTLEKNLDELRLLALKPNVLAIGECGLDRLIDVPLNKQEAIFKEQLYIAEQVRKPVIIHCVKSFDDLVRIKKECKVSVPLIVHGYNNNQQIMLELLKNGFYISFGKALLQDGSNAAKLMPALSIEKLFLETDDADISIKTIFERAAELKNMNVNKLREKVFLNFKQLFKI